MKWRKLAFVMLLAGIVVLDNGCDAGAIARAAGGAAVQAAGNTAAAQLGGGAQGQPGQAGQPGAAAQPGQAGAAPAQAGQGAPAAQAGAANTTRAFRAGAGAGNLVNSAVGIFNDLKTGFNSTRNR